MEPALGLTEEGMSRKGQLQMLFYVHLGVALVKVIVLGFAFGFGDLIQCLVLYCGYSQHSFCNIFIYMLVCLILAMQIAMPAGLAIQNGTALSDAYKSLIKNVNSGFTLTFMLGCMVFYIIAVIFSFKAYREFKYSHELRNQPINTGFNMNYGSIKE